MNLIVAVAAAQVRAVTSRPVECPHGRKADEYCLACWKSRRERA